jgi:very-short-patch-repair endonuclease
MKKGEYKHTEEALKKISEKSKEMWKNKDIRDNLVNKIKESHSKEEFKNKQRELRKLQINSPENSEEVRKKFSDVKKGIKKSEATIIKMKNKIFSKEHRENLSKASKGRKFPIERYPNFGIRSIRKDLIMPLKDTSIEVKIQSFLKQLNIDFFTHQHMNINHAYQCDILIPSLNTVIECDGDYWHKYPIGNDIDHIRTKELLGKGFRVLRLWEYEIKVMDLNNFKERLNI